MIRPSSWRGKDDGLRSLAEYALRGINHLLALLGTAWATCCWRTLPSTSLARGSAESDAGAKPTCGCGELFWRTATRSKKWMAQGRCAPARSAFLARLRVPQALFSGASAARAMASVSALTSGAAGNFQSIEWGYARAAESSQVFADIYAEKMSGMPIMHGFFLCWPFVFWSSGQNALIVR